jgi:hypothetical protein
VLRMAFGGSCGAVLYKPDVTLQRALRALVRHRSKPGLSTVQRLSLRLISPSSATYQELVEFLSTEYPTKVISANMSLGGLQILVDQVLRDEHPNTLVERAQKFSRDKRHIDPGVHLQMQQDRHQLGDFTKNTDSIKDFTSTESTSSDISDAVDTGQFPTNSFNGHRSDMGR